MEQSTRPVEASQSVNRLPTEILQILGLTIVYFIFAKLGLVFAYSAEQTSVIWPASGVSLSALILFGYRLWPGIALGAFLANFTTGGPAWTAIPIACGNTLESLAGAWMLNRFVKFDPALSRVKDILGLILIAATGSTAISATIGVTSLCLSGDYPWDDFYSRWWLWWFGDGMGNLVVATFILSWVSWLRDSENFREWPDYMLLGLFLLITTLLIFQPNSLLATLFPPRIIVFPLVIWAALRLGPPGTSLTVLVILMMAITAALLRIEPFVGDVEENIIGIQVYLCIVALTGLVIASANAERRLNATAVKKSREEIRFILDAAGVGTWDWNLKTGNLQSSENMRDIYGLPPKTFQRGLDDFLKEVHPDDRERVRTATEEAIQKGKFYDIEYRRFRGDGSVGWLAVKGKAFRNRQGETVRLSGICYDITPRKSMEKELREINLTLEQRIGEGAAEIRRREARFFAVFENRAMGMAIVDPRKDFAIIEANRTLEWLLGHSARELIGKPLFDFMDSTEDPSQFERLLDRTVSSFSVERKMSDREDDALWANVFYSLLEDPQSSEPVILAIFENITERVEAETALWENDEMVRTFVGGVEDYAILLLDPDGNVISWNTGAQIIKGYRSEEILGRHFSKFFTPDDIAEGVPELALKTAAAEGKWTYEGWHVAKGGLRFLVSTTLTALHDDAGEVRGYAKITRDITERRKLEELVANSTLEEQRRIAGLLHDGVGQQLTATRFTAELLSKKLKGIETDEGRLARRVCENVAEALEEIRNLSRGIHPVEVDSGGLSVALKNLLEETESTYGVPCHFRTEGRVEFSENNTPTQIYYIAREAVNNEMKHGAPSMIETILAEKDDIFELTIQGDGKGFHLDSVGEGGIGLKTMRYRASLVGARLVIDSSPGNGTSIRCSLENPRKQHFAQG